MCYLTAKSNIAGQLQEDIDIDGWRVREDAEIGILNTSRGMPTAAEQNDPYMYVA